MEKQFCLPLEGTLAHGINVGRTLRIVAVTHFSVVLFHNMRFQVWLLLSQKIPSAGGGVGGQC